MSSFKKNRYIYIYIYVCVCVCVYLFVEVVQNDRYMDVYTNTFPLTSSVNNGKLNLY